MSTNKQRMLSDRAFYTACPTCSAPPGKFRFNIHSLAEADTLLADGAEVSCLRHTYSVRDGILLALSQSPYEGNNMFWAFTSTSERQGLVDLRIGIVEEILFDEPFEEVFYVAKSSLPPKVTKPDYGSYAFQLCVDVLRPSGFKFISSFFNESPRTDEEICVLIGWNAYGRMKHDEVPPIWRRMLANAYRHLLLGVWYLALLEAAFALESFFDSLLSSELNSRGVPDSYIKHVLRVGERLEELRTLNEIRNYPAISNNQIRKLGKDLDEDVFASRNHLAHGKWSSSEITREHADRAINRVQRVIWDWDVQARRWLLLIERESSIYDLRDET